MTLSYDFNEAAEGGNFVTLPEGRYVFKFIKAEAGKSNAGNPKAIVTLQVAAGKFDGDVITQHWPTNGKASFRFRDFLASVGFKPKEKGKLDLRKYYGSEIGAIVTLRDNDEGEAVFNDLKGLIPGDQMRDMLGIDDDDEEEFEDEEEDEEEFDDEEEDEDEEDEEDEDEEDEEEITKADLKEMDLDELKELAEEWEVSTRKPRGKTLTKAIMRKRLAEYIDSLGEEGEEEEDEEDEEPF